MLNYDLLLLVLLFWTFSLCFLPCPVCDRNLCFPLQFSFFFFSCDALHVSKLAFGAAKPELSYIGKKKKSSLLFFLVICAAALH